MKPTEPPAAKTRKTKARPGTTVAAQPAPRRFRFEPAGGLVMAQIRAASEKRGFAVTRLLTHWADVAGPELARLCRPQRVSYAQRGFGATLIVEAPGAAAPLVSMRLDGLRERINAIYGYAAIARIQLVQGRLEGMAEAQSPFAGPGPTPGAELAAQPGAGRAGLRSDNLAPPSPARMARLRDMVDGLTEGVSDPGLREALDRLALNVLNRGPGRGPSHGTE